MDSAVVRAPSAAAICALLCIRRRTGKWASISRSA